MPVHDLRKGKRRTVRLRPRPPGQAARGDAREHVIKARAPRRIRPQLQRKALLEGRVAAREIALAPGPHQGGERDVERADRLAASAEARSVGQIAGAIDALELRRQDRAHRTGIDRAVSVAADRAIDRAVIEAGPAADAAQHGGELAAEHLAPPVVEQDDMVGAGAVGIAVPPRTRREGRIGGDVLAGRRAGQEPEQHRCVLERRHDLLDRGDDDMAARQCRGQVSVSLIGDDHR